MSSKECGRGVFVRRMAWVLGVCLAVAVFLTGCELIRIEEGERTPVEYAIVKLFMQNPGRALSREDILAAVWGRDYDGELKIVDVNIRRLRIKIEDDTASPTYITTVWGFGYKWGA